MSRVYQAGWSLREALKAASTALCGPDKPVAVQDLEVAVLSRNGGRRAFRRIDDEETASLLGVDATSQEESATMAPKVGAGSELGDLSEPAVPKERSRGSAKKGDGASGGGAGKKSDSATGSDSGDSAADDGSTH